MASGFGSELMSGSALRCASCFEQNGGKSGYQRGWRERERESEREISKHTTANSPLGIIHTCSNIQSQAHFVLAEFCACHQRLAFRRVALFLCSFSFFALDTILQKRNPLGEKDVSTVTAYASSQKRRQRRGRKKASGATQHRGVRETFQKQHRNML